jgi:hypothetical protein
MLLIVIPTWCFNYTLFENDFNTECTQTLLRLLIGTLYLQTHVLKGPNKELGRRKPKATLRKPKENLRKPQVWLKTLRDIGGSHPQGGGP